MAREIWSTDFVTDSRTGTDGPLWWGESAQEGCQRTLSRTRGRERTVRCGGESPRRRAVNGPLRVTDSRTGTDVRFGRESPRGREAGQWRAGFGSTDSVTDSRTGTDGPLWEGRVHAGGRLSMARGFGSTDSVANSRTGTDVRFGRGRVHAGGNPNLTCLRESMIDRGSSPREQAG